MEYTILGSSNIKVSKICLGTMTWGVQNNQEEAFEQMDYALAQGINFWDTAEMYAIPPTPETYGTTETIIGNWFKNTGKRNDVILATKFSPMIWARGEGGEIINKDNIIIAVDNSLKRLKTDYIDLYQLHWPTNRSNYHFDNWWNFKPAFGSDEKERITDNKIEILQIFDILIKAGKIRHIGLSDDSAWGIKHYVDLSEKYNLPKITSIQNEYNLLRRRDEYDVAETCALENIAYLPWSPLAMGVLSGKYLDGKFPKGSRFSKEIMKGQEDRFLTRLDLYAHKATREYINIAKKYNLDPCQMAIAFTIINNWAISTIIGATKMDQLKKNIEAINIDLSPECLADIQIIYKKYPIAF